MAGLIFIISLVSILTMVGFLFAWMVRLASVPEQSESKDLGMSSALAKNPIRGNKH